MGNKSTNLRKGNTRRIALKLELDWPYKRHTGIFAGANQYGKEEGWETVIDEFVEEPGRYDGIIARASESLAQRSGEQGTPLVNVWQNSPAKNLASVFPDSLGSAKLRAEHLLDRGFRCFAALSEREAAARLEAAEFRRLVTAAGYPCITSEVASHITKSLSRWQKTEATIAEWMDRWQLPTGVHAHSDFLGRIVAQKCLDRGWRIPEDVGIVAGMNEEAICEQPKPSISSVEVGYERVGYEAARLLDRLMRQRSQPTTNARPPRILIPPQGLIVRESSDFYSVEDALVAAAMEFIAANSHRDIGQDDVAAAVSMETRTLQNRFRKVLNRPVASVIRRARIDRAKRELTQSDHSMAVIARNAGFSGPERLNEVFRRELGVSPSQYRRQRQLGG